MKIVAIVGSLRAESSNMVFTQAVVKLAPDDVYIHVYRDLGTIPLFSPDIDTTEPPMQVAQLRSQLNAADAVIICTPEYANGMPGSLKNALDWLVSSAQLYKKPVAALSTSPSERGGDRALGWLQQTLNALDAAIPQEASFAVPHVKSVLSEDGVNDVAIVEQINKMFASLRSIVD